MTKKLVPSRNIPFYIANVCFKQALRDWEEQTRQLRVEKEKAMQRRKLETEKRLRELQEMVEEKRKEREDKLEMIRTRKVLQLAIGVSYLIYLSTCFFIGCSFRSRNKRFGKTH